MRAWRWFRSRLAYVAPAGLILLAVLAAYGDSFNGPFVYDDSSSIPDNPTIRQLWPVGRVLSPPTSGQTVSGRPLLNLSFAINYALGGTEVRGYHAVNLAIHFVNALLVFGILRRTLLMPAMNGRFPGAATPLALAAALLWALHPLQTESVTYLVQRAESLGALFYLLTLYGVVRGVGSRRAVSWYAGSVAACLLGMATKEVMVTAPVVLLLYDRTFVAGSFREALRRRWGLYAGLAATWGLLACLVTKTGLIGRSAEFGAPDPWSYARTQPAVVLYYLRLSVWPHPLCLDYAWPVAQSLQEILPGVLVLGLLVAATAWGLTGGRAWGFLGASFLLILAPTSSVVPLAQLAFEHRMYLPLVTLVTGVVVGAYVACLWLERCGLLGPTWRKAIGVGLLAATSLALGVLTGLRNADYASDVSLWEDTVLKAPHNPRAHNNLGVALSNLGRIPEALKQYNEAVRLDPDYTDAHNNLGNVLANAGRVPEAIEHCNKALRLKPDLAEAHNNLGNALVRVGRVPEAVEHYNEALRVKPDFADAHNNLGNALVILDRTPEAIEHLNEALRLKPDYAEAHYNLGNAVVRRGRFPEAVEHYLQALRLKPDLAEAHNNLGNALVTLGRTPEAVEHWNQALRLAEASGKEPLARTLRARLELPRDGRGPR